MRWLYQAITHLCFNSTIPSTDPQIVTVTNQLREMKDWHSDIVSLKNNYTHQFQILEQRAGKQAGKRPQLGWMGNLLHARRGLWGP